VIPLRLLLLLSSVFDYKYYKVIREEKAMVKGRG
jgi:hypothetical protein